MRLLGRGLGWVALTCVFPVRFMNALQREQKELSIAYVVGPDGMREGDRYNTFSKEGRTPFAHTIVAFS